ncbi:MAG: META domain-containing protein [Candidatus Methanofastidiosum sp.]|nr:META domain-containing protein [Methanofastidiosum sp.]
MKNKIILISTIFFISIILIGCANQPPPNFESTSWKLDSYVGSLGNLVSPISNSKMTLEFNDGRISGSSGCNSFFAKYTVEGKSMSFGLIGATKMYCSNPSVMEQEQTYFMRLESVKSYKIEGNKLTLIDANGKTVLIFSKN